MTEADKREGTETVIPLQQVVHSLYQSQGKVYTRSVTGLFNNWRWVMVWLTQLFFYGVPWLEWGQRQAMLFDLDTRRFYIFGLVFNPQDLIYLTFLLIISALALFLFTAIAGRLWCGYTCPQTVYTEIFQWVETKIEGDRAARIKLDESKASKHKILRKVLKHVVWIAIALWTGFTFVGYFTPIRELFDSMMQLTLGPWETFWVGFYGFATYGNAGFMREQVCKYMCPYARFQSVMFDDDTLTVTYDEARGEPRGGRNKNVDLETSNLGACIDCSLCVQVCPTGIDIRDGLQIECIGCGACADVCDTVMDKMGYAPGLIKYSTQNAMTNRWSNNQIMQRILRPRVLIYSAILSVLVIGLSISLYFKPSFRVDVLRDRAVMSRITEDNKLENVYRLKITNNLEQAQTYAIKVTGDPLLEAEFVEGQTQFIATATHQVSLAANASETLVMDIEIRDGALSAGTHPIAFEVTSLSTQETSTEKSVFIITN